MSSSGDLLASGQVTEMTMNAIIIVWDLRNLMPLHTLALHKVRLGSKWGGQLCLVLHCGSRSCTA